MYFFLMTCDLSEACAQLLSQVWLFVTPWTVAHRAPLSTGFPRQEYWRELPFPHPGDLPDLGIEPMSPESPAFAGGFFTTAPWSIRWCNKLRVKMERAGGENHWIRLSRNDLRRKIRTEIELYYGNLNNEEFQIDGSNLHYQMFSGSSLT